jgi:choline dehydrogenase-like flavoprotein
MMVARLNRPVWSSWLKSLAISVAFDLAPALRRRALSTRRTALDPARIAADRGALRELASTRTSVTYHGVGTCRMGGADDPNAVVDPSCRVRKVTGLRVVDGSVMPTIVSGNTNLPIIMIAEKVSAQILSEYTSVSKA